MDPVAECYYKLKELCDTYDNYNRTLRWTKEKNEKFVIDFITLRPCAEKLLDALAEMKASKSPAKKDEYNKVFPVVEMYIEKLTPKAQIIQQRTELENRRKLLNIDHVMSVIDPNYDARYMQSVMPSVSTVGGKRKKQTKKK
jgi:hypothetical protein